MKSRQFSCILVHVADSAEVFFVRSMAVSENFQSCPWLIVKFSCVVQDRLKNIRPKLPKVDCQNLCYSSVTDLETFPELSMPDFLTDDKFSESSLTD